MDARNNLADEFVGDWRDPFPEPRTIPAAWNVSEFLAIPWPFAPLEATRAADLPLYAVLSSILRTALARVGDFVSSFSHSIATR